MATQSRGRNKTKKLAVLATLALALPGAPQAEAFVNKADLVVEKARTSKAPEMPPAIDREEPRLVEVAWTATETQPEIVEGQKYLQYWAIEGLVPGPALRVREGDVIHVSLTNALRNQYAHNIDFHFVTGPGGGAMALSVEAGQTATIEVRALHPGFFMYHCATHDIPMHIANGMYGFVLVEPAEKALAPVDREFYIVQSEFYADETKDGNLTYSAEKGDLEQPTYMFFNGKYGALLDEAALHAKVGDRVRLYVGNAGPNLISSFHLIGEIFDRVYREADLVSEPGRSVQTTLIPSGGAVVVDFQVDVPGTYLLVDHAIFRLHKGLMGQLVVDGAANPEIFAVVKEAVPGKSPPDGHRARSR